MPVDPAGLATASAALAAEDAAWAEEQADLFAGSPLLGGDKGEALRRKGGRPAGSQNTSTKAWSSFILRHYRSPLLCLGDIATADPFELHAAIVEADLKANLERSVSLLAVINLQRSAAADLAAYVHRRQPLAIDAGEDKALPSINFVQVAAAGVFGEEVHAAQGLQVFGPVTGEPEVAGAKSHGDEDAG